MKILIAGSGKIGSTLARQLSQERCDLTLIDISQKVLEVSMENYDVMGIQGNCASMDTLHQAGVEDTDLLIAMTGSDEINLLCCVTAHFMNPSIHTIARIKHREYAGQISSMRNAFALSMSISPDRLAAEEIHRLLKYPGFLKRDSFARGYVEIVELKISSGDRMAGVALSRMSDVVKSQVLICAVLRDGTAFIPSGDFTLEAGDRIFVTGTSENLSKMLGHLGIITHRARQILLAGGSRISMYLADSLIKEGMSVMIIESDPERCRQLSIELPEASIILGDASDQQLLNQEGIRQCDAFVTLTGQDETNIVMSLYGRICKVPQVITKLGRTENLQVIDSLPLGSVVSPRDLCTNSIVRYVRAMQNQEGAATTIHMIADGQVEAIEFVADSHTRHCGEPLKNILIRKDVLLAGITRKGKTEIPSGDSSFEEGDSLVVVSAGSGKIRQLNDIFEN